MNVELSSISININHKTMTSHLTWRESIYKNLDLPLPFSTLLLTSLSLESVNNCFFHCLNHNCAAVPSLDQAHIQTPAKSAGRGIPTRHYLYHNVLVQHPSSLLLSQFVSQTSSFQLTILFHS